MTRIVFALDVTTSLVSIGRVAETDDGTPAFPQRSWVELPPSSHHTPRHTWERTERWADEVFGVLTSGDVPDLVMVAKQLWGPMAGRKDPKTKHYVIPPDPSAHRRMMLAYAIEQRLHAAGVRVAEFPYVTLRKWALGYTPSKASDKTPVRIMSDLADFAKVQWGVERPVVVSPAGNDVPMPYRPAVCVLAAAGAMAVGVSVAGIDVTEDRLATLSGDTNAAVQWPKNYTPPSDPKSWDELRRHPEILTVGVPA